MNGPHEEERFAEELGARLKREVPPAPFDQAGVKARIAESISAESTARRLVPRRSVLSAAAVFVAFLAGVGVGRAGPATPAERSLESRDIPLEIQAAGSEYIAAVARYTQFEAMLSPEEREQARAAAFAALYGVTVELTEADGIPDRLRSAAGEVRLRSDGVIWF